MKENKKEHQLFVGSKIMQLKDKSEDITFPVLVHYPTLEPSGPTAFGPYTMDVSPDAKIAEGKYPLVIISHGNSGSHLLYRTISSHLAKHGYIVAMPEHYGNNRNNNDLANSIENLKYRPRHISLTIDELLSDNDFSKNITADKIAIIGHSFGGYTALVVAGGTPWTQAGERVNVSSDSRVKALVLMAPATTWFIPENSLAKVSLPILLFAAEQDRFTPRWHTDIVLDGVAEKSQVTLRSIKNAGHFSFLSPFPAALQNPNFLPSTDPEGFDRAQFHLELREEILGFLEENFFLKSTRP